MGFALREVCNFDDYDLMFRIKFDINVDCYLAVGITLFYICVIIYLFGDLAIYAAAVPKSLRDVAW